MFIFGFQWHFDILQVALVTTMVAASFCYCYCNIYLQDLERRLNHTEKEKNKLKDKVNEYHERAAELQDVVEKLQVSH